MKTIVVGYDGSDGATRALDRAAEIARAFSSTLVVVSVADLPVPSPSYGMGPAGFPDAGYKPPLDVDPEELLSGVLGEAEEHLASAGVEVELEARRGSPDAALIEVADARSADLIVVGTREPGRLERILEGSVSSDLARRAHCDVLVVHPPHK